jgi:hypothetical protein
MSAALRKAPETQSMVFPALTCMLMEVEKNTEAWATADEDPEMVSSDPVSTGQRPRRESDSCVCLAHHRLEHRV